jgi:hypothetical protein
MMQFIATMRRLSGGKPAGFKFCVGHPWEFLAICKAMLETEIYPDFIVVDGMEGGTGAAPLEFVDHLGMPLREGLNFVHNALIGIDARDRIKLGAGGKIISAFDIARVIALGADVQAAGACRAGQGRTRLQLSPRHGRIAGRARGGGRIGASTPAGAGAFFAPRFAARGEKLRRSVSLTRARRARRRHKRQALQVRLGDGKRETLSGIASGGLMAGTLQPRP